MLLRALVAALLPALLSASVFASNSVWTRKTLLSSGDKIADDPSLVVQSIGETYWCPPDMLVAWVRVGPVEAPDAWLLVSIRQGVVKSIIRQGPESKSRYGTPDLSPTRITKDSKWLGTTGVFAARGRALLSSRAMLEWDGESLRAIAVPDQEIRIGESSYKLQRMQVPHILGQDANGGVLLVMPVGAPRKGVIVTRYDGKTFSPLVSTLAELPGMQGVRLDPSLLDPTVYTPANGGLFVRSRVEGATYKSGLFWVETGRTELITPLGQSKAGLLAPASAVQTVSIDSANASREAYVVRATNNKGTYTLFRRTAEGMKVLRPPGTEPGALRMYPGIFVTHNPPLYLYMSSRATTQNYVEVTQSEHQTVFDAYWLVGPDGVHREVTRPASATIEVRVKDAAGNVTSSVETRWVASGLYPRFRHFDRGIPGMLMTPTIDNIPIDSLLAFAKAFPLVGGLGNLAAFLPKGENAMVAVPVLETEEGAISLLAVSGFSDDDHAIVATSESIVQLTRAR